MDIDLSESFNFATLLDNIQQAAEWTTMPMTTDYSYGPGRVAKYSCAEYTCDVHIGGDVRKKIYQSLCQFDTR